MLSSLCHFNKMEFHIIKKPTQQQYVICPYLFLPQRFHALQWAISLEYQTGFSLDNFPIFLCLETIYKFPFFYGETCFNTTFNTSLCYKEFLLKWEQSAQIIIAVKSYDSNDHLLGTYIFSRLLMHSRGNFERLGYGSFLTKKLGWDSVRPPHPPPLC